MTATRADLLRAALASPDDAERLVYADFLEQQGETARAQVIHLQCELAHHEPDDRLAHELGWEVAFALAELGERWREELPVLDGVEWTALERGLAGAVRVRDLPTLMRHADAIASAAPITRVELTAVGPPDTPTTPLPWLRVLRLAAAFPVPAQGGPYPVVSLAPELELAPGAGDELTYIERDPGAPLRALVANGRAALGRQFAERLADAPWAAELIRLEIATHHVDDNSGYAEDPRLGREGARLLYRLAKLECLNIDGQGVGAELGKLASRLPALRELSARDCGCANLTLGKTTGAPLARLDLGRNAIGSAGARAIAQAPRFAALQRLVLDTCEVESAGVAAIAASPMWHELRWLDLSRNAVGASGVHALADAPRPAKLHALLVADADLDERAVQVLAKIPWVGELARLDLSGNILGRGAGALRTIAPDALRSLGVASIGLERSDAAALARFWPRLVELDAGGNPLTDAGLERFVTMKEAAALQTLRLRDAKLGADGLELLATRARCPRLRTLELAGNEVAPAALAQLLASPLVARLEALDLQRCELTPEAIDRLARLPLPPRLRRLDLRGNELDEASLLVLADAPALHAVELALDGSPWGFAASSRERLAARFGARWYQRDDD